MWCPSMNANPQRTQCGARRFDRVRELSEAHLRPVAEVQFAERLGRPIGQHLRAFEGQQPSRTVEFECRRLVRCRDPDTRAHLEHRLRAQLTHQAKEQIGPARRLARGGHRTEGLGDRVLRQRGAGVELMRGAGAEVDDLRRGRRRQQQGSHQLDAFDPGSFLSVRTTERRLLDRGHNCGRRQAVDAGGADLDATTNPSGIADRGVQEGRDARHRGRLVAVGESLLPMSHPSYPRVAPVNAFSISRR
ncbi:MAG: hypothetical protein QOF92_889 [Pseudonocardiales bacterium]|nr:hypothetical protein [Pseudonocardiales bacterium]